MNLFDLVDHSPRESLRLAPAALVPRERACVFCRASVHGEADAALLTAGAEIVATACGRCAAAFADPVRPS